MPSQILRLVLSFFHETGRSQGRFFIGFLVHQDFWSGTTGISVNLKSIWRE